MKRHVAPDPKDRSFCPCRIWGTAQWHARASQVALVVKNPPASAGDLRAEGTFLGQEGPLEEGMATHSRILAWRIPGTEEPGGLQSIGSQRQTRLK